MTQTFYVQALEHRPQRISCSLIDYFVFRSPVSIVFFYPKAIDENLLIHSLQHVLSDFPIFAGVLVKENDQLYIDCNNQGVSVQITHSSQSLSQQIANFHKLAPLEFVNIIDPKQTLKQKKPVLTIKINYYTDGMTIGYCWHHSIGDMSTFMELLKALSIFTQGKNYQKPIIPNDREKYLQKWQKKEPDILQTSSSGLKRMGFTDIVRFIKEIYSPKRNLVIYFTEEEIHSLKTAMSNQAEKRLSRNDVVCAHILDLLASCRNDPSKTHYTSILVNVRKRAAMPPNVLGNYVDTLNLTFDIPFSVQDSVSAIHESVKNYRFYDSRSMDFIEQNGGMKKIERFIPKTMLPEKKNLKITNWSNFDVYSIDFGIASPILFMPVGKVLLPWVSCIVEGFCNKGLFVSLILPNKVAKHLNTSAMLEKIHQYREHLSPEATAFLKENSWCL